MHYLNWGDRFDADIAVNDPSLVPYTSRTKEDKATIISRNTKLKRESIAATAAAIAAASTTADVPVLEENEVKIENNNLITDCKVEKVDEPLMKAFEINGDEMIPQLSDKKKGRPLKQQRIAENEDVLGDCIDEITEGQGQEEGQGQGQELNTELEMESGRYPRRKTGSGSGATITSPLLPRNRNGRKSATVAVASSNHIEAGTGTGVGVGVGGDYVTDNSKKSTSSSSLSTSITTSISTSIDDSERSICDSFEESSSLSSSHMIVEVGIKVKFEGGIEEGVEVQEKLLKGREYGSSAGK